LRDSIRVDSGFCKIDIVTFVAISSVGPNRDPSKGAREHPVWEEHAVFIDQLVEEAFIEMGGPLSINAGSRLAPF
jgi:hypothetical protein